MSTDKRMDEIIEKIQKLLSLATSPNQHEAEAASSRASAMLLKYNLEMQQIEDKDFSYGEMKVCEISQLKWHQKYITDLMEEYFFVRVIFSKAWDDARCKRTRSIKFVGKKANCRIALYVFAYLNNCYPSLWWAYKDAMYKKGIKLYKGHRDSYFKGLTDGVRKNLDITKFRVQEEMGLVLMKDEKLDKYVEELTGGKAISTTEKEFYPTIALQGFHDGINIKLKKGIEADQNESEVLFITGGEK